jgi:predicted anti-sigma-YlaC factor YlaD
MNCKIVNEALAELLLAPEELNTGVRAELDEHVESCASCREQLDGLRSTMQLMDAWEAPEPNPYFLTRLHARLDEERAAEPAGWLERLKARLIYGSRLTTRPVAAMALTVAVLVGGGAYLGLSDLEAPRPTQPQAAVVHDLQTMDSNAQVLDQLETLSDQND